jgi:hypothetical protein
VVAHPQDWHVLQPVFTADVERAEVEQAEVEQAGRAAP